MCDGLCNLECMRLVDAKQNSTCQHAKTLLKKETKVAEDNKHAKLETFEPKLALILELMK